MNIEDLQGKLVGVLGYGMEGKAVISFLLRQGVTPTLFDRKPWDDWSAGEQEEIKNAGINFILGPDYAKELAGFNVVFRSPGIKLSDIKPYVPESCIITSQTKWFFEHCPAKIVGVTGTKGKGTTSTLIYEMLKKQFTDIFLTGNIGKVQPFEILEDLKSEGWVVYELSSFQLQDLTKSPHISVVLMVTQDHLDYHSDVEEYIEAKKSIVKYQDSNDYCIYNIDYPSSLKISNSSKAHKIEVSRFQEVDKGCFIRNGSVYAKNLLDKKEIDIIKTSEILLRGEHNLENVCAATAAGLIAGVSPENIKKSLKSFKGLEHRLEFVEEKNGVKYFNDSISTIPDTAAVAIKSFHENKVLILGGATKHSDFAPLGEAIVNNPSIRGIVLVGVEGERIRKAIDNVGKFNGPILEGAKNMDEIVAQASSIAQPGDVVLLSPACTSYDMFKNYKDRGEQFKYFVQKL